MIDTEKLNLKSEKEYYIKRYNWLGKGIEVHTQIKEFNKERVSYMLKKLRLSGRNLKVEQRYS